MSEAEATARRMTDLTEECALERARVRSAIRRSNVVSISNLPLLGMTAANALQGTPVDALISFGAVCFNTGINIFQQSRTADRAARSLFHPGSNDSGLLAVQDRATP